MQPQLIQTVCGYSCSTCDHHRNECPGCTKTTGKPFWIAYAGIDRCAIYDCCTNDRKLQHCGKCPDLICERFTRFKDPGMSDTEAAACLAAMEKELRKRT